MERELAERFERLENMIVGNSKKMLNSKEAAEYMGCPRRTIWELARDREIPHYKDPRGRIIRFLRSDLDAYMQYLRIDSQQEMDEAVARRMIGYKLGQTKRRAR